MNLKEAFRFQNKLQSLMEEAGFILEDERNITQVSVTVLHKKVMPEKENETTIEPAPSEYAEQITEMAGFLLFLLEERERLSHAIRLAKAKLPIDMDGEVGLNARRQTVIGIFRRMVDLRNSEKQFPGGATGYRFNAEGNQVAYRCDEKRVTTIRYDRSRIRACLRQLTEKTDAVSVELDRCLINSEVEYSAPFDVNDSFASVFDAFLERTPR